MAIGNNSEFIVAWRGLRETFVRKLALKYLGVNIDAAAMRTYDLNKPLTTIVTEIKRKNILATIIFRANRRMRVFIKPTP